MMRTPIHPVIKQAREVANRKGYFVVEKPEAYLLYRSAKPTNVFVGKRRTPDAFLQLVKTACGNEEKS